MQDLHYLFIKLIDIKLYELFFGVGTSNLNLDFAKVVVQGAVQLVGVRPIITGNSSCMFSMFPFP